MEFVDEHFAVICMKTGAKNLSESFTCLRKVIAEKKVLNLELLIYGLW